MCGRTRCTLGEEQVTRVAGTSRWADREQYRPSYNVSPGAPTPVVRVAGDGEVQVQTMRWGLVPSFTKKDEKPDFWRMFNARSESVAEKPSFRRLVPTRRCLVLVEGFYEWQKEKGGAKQPYYIHLAPSSSGTNGDSAGAGSAAGSGSAGAGGGKQGGKLQEGEPFVMAGLYDVWDGPEGPMYTYTILTTDSSKRLEWLHDRMPVILRTQQAQQAWLHMGSQDLGKLLHLCVPYAGEDLVWHPVTRQMNTPSFQGPECCQEVKKPKVQDFFKPRTAPAASPTAALKQEPAADRGSSQEQQQAAATAAAPEIAATSEIAAEGTAGRGGAKAEQVGDVKKEAGSAPLGQQQGAASAQAAAPAAVNTDERPEELGSASTGQTNSSQAAAGEAQGGGQKQQDGQQRQQAKEAASLSAGQKRKQATGGIGGSAGKKGAGSASKKAKPPGQPDITRFFASKAV